MPEQPAGWTTPDPRNPDAAGATAQDPGLPAYAAPPPYPGPAAGRPPRGVVPLRPLALGELLDGAVAVIRRCPRPVLAASAAVAAVGAVLQLLVTLSVRGPLADASAGTANGSSDALANLAGAAAVATGLDLLIGIVTGALLTGVVTAVVGRAVFGDETGVRQAWDAVRPRLVPLLIVSLVIAVASYGAFFGALGLVALVALASGLAAGLIAVVLVPAGAVLAVLLYVRWSLAPAAVVLEKQSVVAALRRSSLLVSRSFWRLLGILLLAALIAGFVGLVLTLPFQLFGLSPLRGFGGGAPDLSGGSLVLSAVAGALVATVVAPFSAGVRALLYVDRRMRAEGLDVALVAAAAARSAAR